MGNIKDEISKNLLYYRKKSGLTQKEFAEKLGVKNTAVSNWENNQNSIDIETLVKACNIFGISINQMYESNNDFFNLSSHEINVIKAYRAKPEMQPAIDKLLGVENVDPLLEDMKNTAKEINFPIKQK